MRTFSASFRLECKRIFTWRKGILLILLFLLLVYQLQVGLGALKDQQEYKELFKATYWEYFESIRNYTVYSVYGIEVLFWKSNLNFLFRNSSVPDNVTSKFDNTSSLRVFQGIKGLGLNPGSLFSGLDFSSVLTLFGTLMALFYGIGTINRKEYSRFLSTPASPGKFFFSTVLSRTCIIALGMLFLYAVVLLMMRLNGVAVPVGGYVNTAAFMFVAFLMLAFFYLIGVGCGTMRDKALAVGLAFGAWFLFLVVIPGFMEREANKYAPGASAAKKVEQAKFKIISDFEVKAKNEKGEFDKNKIIEIGREVMKKYMANEFKQVKALEADLIDRTESYSKYYARLMKYTPVSFFFLTGNEVSSGGFWSSVDFYRYSSDLQAEFARFYIDRCYYNDPKIKVSFIRDEENIYPAQSRLPEDFFTGILFVLGWLVLAVAIDFFLFLVSLHRVEAKEKLGPDNRAVILGKNELKVFRTEKAKGVEEKLFNLLSGKPRAGETIKLEIDNVDLTENRKPVDFVYLCHPDFIPGDIRVGDWLRFMACLLRVPRNERPVLYASAKDRGIKSVPFRDLDRSDRGKVFTAVLSYIKSPLYLVGDVGVDMPVDYLIDLNDVMLGWTVPGSPVICLTTAPEIELERFALRKRGGDFTEEAMWSEKLSRLKELNAEKRE